eukprot:TRINITY_DN102758_c0_g1_i1.p1 TRINITY_DN102758_c0_g1~~TRINITY_DN102758_c0_g1_i1.p1  ORF type:complete len:466 (-),score=72.17 TRINITY_DN102758_c0_g1_i1:159-1556(-)
MLRSWLVCCGGRDEGLKKPFDTGPDQGPGSHNAGGAPINGHQAQNGAHHTNGFDSGSLAKKSVLTENGGSNEAHKPSSFVVSFFVLVALLVLTDEKNRYALLQTERYAWVLNSLQDASVRETMYLCGSVATVCLCLLLGIRWLCAAPAEPAARQRSLSFTGSTLQALSSKMVAAGVPRENADGVAALALAVGATKDNIEPMSDPLTLLRFYNAREGDIGSSSSMYKAAMAWRGTYSIPRVMALHGGGQDYDADGSRSGESTVWNWHRNAGASPEAKFAGKHAFFGRLRKPAPDGAPIAIWRLGSMDMVGIQREGTMEVIKQALVSHIEDLVQSGRAASLKQGRLVRVRLVLDASGLGLNALKSRKALQDIMRFGTMYFPEVIASATFVRAPWAAVQVFKAVKPILTERQRRKVSFLGTDFKDGLKRHSGLEVSSLPRFLGGEVPDDEVCESLSVPYGAGKEFASR